MRIGSVATRQDVIHSSGTVVDTRVHVHHVGGNPVNQQVSCLERGCANLP